MRLLRGELKQKKEGMEHLGRNKEDKRKCKTDSVGGWDIRVWLQKKTLISPTVIGSSLMIANKQEADIWIDKMKIQPRSRAFL